MMSPAVSPNFASTPASASIRSSRMKSTSASDSGCGSVTITTSNAFGSSWRFSAKSSEAGIGPVGAQALEGQVERGRRALRLMMAVEARQARQRIDRRHEAGGLDDENRRFVRQRQRIAPVRPGRRDVAAVGDERVGDARIGGVRDARAVAVFEHHPRDRRAARVLQRAPRPLRSPRRPGRPPPRPAPRDASLRSCVPTSVAPPIRFECMKQWRRDANVKGL